MYSIPKKKNMNTHLIWETTIKKTIKKMNLFLLNLDKKKSASTHCKKHAIKMILESCQLCFNCHYRNGTNMESLKAALVSQGLKMYRRSHKNHPIEFGLPMINSTTFGLLSMRLNSARCTGVGTAKRSRGHVCEPILKFLRGWLPPRIPAVIRISSPIAYHDIPDEFLFYPLCFGDAVDVATVRDAEGHALGVASYRAYYHTKQDKFRVSWSPNVVPTWWVGKLDPSDALDPSGALHPSGLKKKV